MTRERHRNPDRLYDGLNDITHDYNFRGRDPDVVADENKRVKDKRRRSYSVKSHGITRRNMSPIWQDNVRIFIKFFNETKDMYLAGKKFSEYKKLQGWQVTTKYLRAIMQDVRGRLALSGVTEAMLKDSCEDIEFAREVALENLADGNVEDIIKVVYARNKLFDLGSYTKQQRAVVVNIDNSKKTINADMNLTVGKDHLEDYLKRLPEDKRQAIRMLALEMKKDGSLPMEVAIKGENMDEKENVEISVSETPSEAVPELGVCEPAEAVVEVTPAQEPIAEVIPENVVEGIIEENK